MINRYKLLSLLAIFLMLLGVGLMGLGGFGLVVAFLSLPVFGIMNFTLALLVTGLFLIAGSVSIAGGHGCVTIISKDEEDCQSRAEGEPHPVEYQPSPLASSCSGEPPNARMLNYSLDM